MQDQKVDWAKIQARLQDADMALTELVWRVIYKRTGDASGCPSAFNVVEDEKECPLTEEAVVEELIRIHGIATGAIEQ